MMTKISSWKSDLPQVEMKRDCLRESFSEHIWAMRHHSDGRLKLKINKLQTPDESKSQSSR